MSTLTPGLQTYNTAFPFDVTFHNQFQDEGLAVLYIVNSIDATKPEQKVRIHINLLTNQPYTFKALSAQEADAASFNLALALRPGTLQSEVESGFSKILETSLNNTLQASENSCSVQGPVTRKADGALVWSCTFEKDLSIANSIVIKDIIVLSNGTLIGLSTDNDCYTKTSLMSGPWIKVNDAPKMLGIAVSQKGEFYYIDTQQQVYTTEKLSRGNGKSIGAGGLVTNISVMPDGSIVGIGLNNHLWYSTTDKPAWQMVNKSKEIINVAAKPDGSLVAVGVDQKLYKSKELRNADWEPDDTYTGPLKGVAVNTDGSLIFIDLNGQIITEENTHETDTRFSFMLEGISAEAGVGSRSTQAEVLFGNVLLNNTGNLLSFKRSLHLDIINHLGHAHAPLHFGVVGKNVLLNKEGYDNKLNVYFETIGRLPLVFGDNTEIEFTFPYDKGASDLIHFGNFTEVSAYSLASSTSPAPVFTGGDAVDNKKGLMTIKAYGFGTQSLVTCIFHFSTIQISGPDGQTVLTITIRNLPGYWDTTYHVPLVKETSVLDGSRLKLLEKNQEPGIEFLPAGEDQKASASIVEDQGLHIDSSTGPITLNSDLVLLKDNIGQIPTVRTQQLQIVDQKGDAYKDNWIGMTDNVEGRKEYLHIGGITGDDKKRRILMVASITKLLGWGGEALLDVGGKVVAKTFEDQKGAIMPVGSIIAYGGKVVPEGWLLCDGTNIDAKFSELIAVVGLLTPDLRGRTIIGTGHPAKISQNDGLESDFPSSWDRTVGDTGGEVFHKLSVEEMPEHNHFVSFQKMDGTWNYDGGDTKNSWTVNNNEQLYSGNTGSNHPHYNMQPYMALNYIIKC